MMRRAGIALAAVLVAVAAGSVSGSAAAGARTSSNSRWVLGYYAGYLHSMMPVDQIEWGTMTHLVVGPVNPKSNGTLDTSLDTDSTTGPKLARTLATKARAHGVVPMLMIGGAGDHDAFRAAAQHHLGSFVDNLVSTMRSLGFKGLDLDWEPLNPSDQPYLKALIDALRSRLPNAVLTMPVGWVTRTFPDVPSFYGTIAKKLDRIDVMTYEMVGAYQGWKTWHSSALFGAGPHTPSSVALNVTAYRKAGVPARKLGVGVGFYGECWTGGVTGPRQPIGDSRIAASDNVMTYPRIMHDYYRKADYHYDTKAQAPYLGFAHPTGPRNCTFVSYENPRSITAKATWARSKGLGALIVWNVNEGHDKSAPRGQRDALLRTVRTAFGA